MAGSVAVRSRIHDLLSRSARPGIAPEEGLGCTERSLRLKAILDWTIDAMVALERRGVEYRFRKRTGATALRVPANAAEPTRQSAAPTFA